MTSKKKESRDIILGEFDIDPRKIRPNEDAIENSIFRNARSTLKREEMATQKESIRRTGLIKKPTVRPLQNSPDPDGYTHQMVAGSRRLRNILKLIKEAEAIIKEGRPFKSEELCYDPRTAEWKPATEVYKTVNFVVRDCDDEAAIAINIAENLEHAKVPELDLMEYCQFLVNLKNDDGTPKYSREWVADKCNRSESWVSLTLDLAQLPDRVKTMMTDDRVTRTAALAFLQTEKTKIDEVIEVGENIVRQEKMAEAQVAEGELHAASIEMADAENDLEIHNMMQNQALAQMAQKRLGTARKRVSAASEKRDTALKEADKPKLTADVINKANLLVPGAKKGAPKAMPVKSIRELHTKFKENYGKMVADASANGDTIILNVANALLESILGHRVCDDLLELIQQEKAKLLCPQPVMAMADETPVAEAEPTE